MGKSHRIRKKAEYFQVSENKRKAKDQQHFSLKNKTPQPCRRIIPRENLLVWGRCRGFGWWPGRIANRSELSGPIDPPDDPTRWINWFGDDKYTDTKVDQMAYFHDFSRFYKESVYRRSPSYRNAVDLAINEAARRTGKLEQNKNILLQWANHQFYPEGYIKFLPNSSRTDYTKLTPTVEHEEGKHMKKTMKLTHTKAKERNKSSCHEIDLVDQLKEALIKVKENVLDLDKICLGCGSLEVVSPHPLFVGSLCELCQVDYWESVYLFDENGYSMYCCVCGGGKEVIICDNNNCSRCFCRSCMDILIDATSFDQQTTNNRWECYLCVNENEHGNLIRRPDWSNCLQAFMNEGGETNDHEIMDLPHIELGSKRKPIRVLSLFDGIATGYLALKELNIDVECYYASEIDHEAICIAEVRHPNNVIVHAGNICDITDKMLEDWGPFDLVIGGSPCNDLSIVNPARRGLWSDKGSGHLFFEYVRVLRSCQLISAMNGGFLFWLFENVVCMDRNTKTTISHFLQKTPICLDAKDVSPAHRPRCFWGNLPGMMRPMIATNLHKLTLQECLDAGRTATTRKLRTITTNINSIPHNCILGDNEMNISSNSVVLQKRNQKDSLWITEIERVFGFPDHYTDACNMSRASRLRVLGRSWSVPVIKHLFSPLTEYFSVSL